MIRTARIYLHPVSPPLLLALVSLSVLTIAETTVRLSKEVLLSGILSLE